jgi:hypothetical protein
VFKTNHLLLDRPDLLRPIASSTNSTDGGLDIRARWFNVIYEKNYGFVFFADSLPKPQEWDSLGNFQRVLDTPPTFPARWHFRPKNTKDFQKMYGENKSKHHFWFYNFIIFV